MGAGNAGQAAGDGHGRALSRGAIGYVAYVRAVSPDVVVIGAGVCGLSTATALLDAGLAVTVYAAAPPHRTTSAAAGALWGPHLVGADERVGGWAEATLRRLRELRDEPAGFTRGAGPAGRCDPAELPPGYASGWRYTAPVIAMPAYLDYLLELLLKQGGQLVLGRPSRSLAEAEERFSAPVIVNG